MFAEEPFRFNDGDEQEIDVITQAHPNGVSRVYRMYIPPEIDLNKAVPLMVDVHGLMGTPWNQGNLTRWDVVANGEIAENRFVTVYPKGTTGRSPFSGEVDKITCFNAGAGLKINGETKINGCCWSAEKEQVEDVEFIDQLVQHLLTEKTKFKIDPKRIYGSGLSNGSALIQKVLVDKPKIFTAVYVASQMLLEFPDEEPSLSVPIMLSHGVRDKTVDYKGGPSVFRIDGEDVEFLFPSAIANAERWAAINNCSPSTNKVRMTLDGHLKPNQTKMWTGCNSGVEVWLRSVRGGHKHYSAELIQEAWEFLKLWPKKEN